MIPVEAVAIGTLLLALLVVGLRWFPDNRAPEKPERLPNVGALKTVTPDPELDGPDEDEWGAYVTTCLTCGLNMMIVATTHAIEFGYAEMMPDAAQCDACLAKEVAR